MLKCSGIAVLTFRDVLRINRVFLQVITKCLQKVVIEMGKRLQRTRYNFHCSLISSVRFCDSSNLQLKI